MCSDLNNFIEIKKNKKLLIKSRISNINISVNDFNNYFISEPLKIVEENVIQITHFCYSNINFIKNDINSTIKIISKFE